MADHDFPLTPTCPFDTWLVCQVNSRKLVKYCYWCIKSQTLSHSQSTLFLYIEQICCFTQYTGYNVFSIRTKSNSQFSTRTTYNSDLPVQSYASKADKTLECINEPLNLLIIASSSYYIRILVANSQLAPALLIFQLKCG